MNKIRHLSQPERHMYAAIEWMLALPEAERGRMAAAERVAFGDDPLQPEAGLGVGGTGGRDAQISEVRYRAAVRDKHDTPYDFLR